MISTFKARADSAALVQAVGDVLHSEAALDNFNYTTSRINVNKGQVHTAWLKDSRYAGFPLRAAALGVLNERGMMQVVASAIDDAFPTVCDAITSANRKDRHVQSWQGLVESLESLHLEMGLDID